MNNLFIHQNTIPAMSDAAIDNVRKLDQIVSACPQTTIKTDHVLHGGMYARTITIPANVVLTGALIKIPTMLITSGDAIVYVDGGSKRITGYNVFAASAGRKQAFVALTETRLTMLFPTNAKTVDEAEKEFTDEWASLMSVRDAASNTVLITGE